MKLVITISRRYGTGASQIAGELSEQLGIPVYDKTHVEEKMCSNSYDSEAAVIIYVCADRKDRIARIMKKENISEEEAAKKLDTTDAERSEYYYEHTGKAWGDVNNYHMILNTSDIGVDRCADALIRYFEQKEII